MSPWGQLCTQPGLPPTLSFMSGDHNTSVRLEACVFFPLGFGSDSSNFYYSQCFLSQAVYKEVTLPPGLFIIPLFPLADAVGAHSIPICLSSRLILVLRVKSDRGSPGF